MKLKDKTAIVVGAGSGIGRATAKLLAAEGASVVAADRNIEGAENVTGEILAAGGEAFAYECNMIREEETEQLVAAAIEKYGKVDILCNIAGGSVGRYIRDKQSPFPTASKEEWDTQLSVNLTGCRNCTRAIIQHMMDRKYGKIVNFSSMAGVDGAPGVVDYSAAKAGVIGFTKALAKEMSPYNIQINSVAPSGVYTERIQAFVDTMKKEKPDGPQMDLSTLAQPEEIARTVLFLVSDDTSHLKGLVVSFSP
ncbi:MAG: SDR family oxidoreductase [Dehalococcoidales bacterium]|nr:SDR family oxidoreductase [Dehalococcoidales bacterium]